MELPRPVARVGELISEHHGTALAVGIVLPLGALAKVVLQRRSNGHTSSIQSTGEGWHDLPPEDLE